MASKFPPNRSQNAQPLTPPYPIAGRLEDGSRFLYRVGATATGEPVYAVAATQDEVEPQLAVRLGQLLARNPEGWEIFEDEETP